MGILCAGPVFIGDQTKPMPATDIAAERVSPEKRVVTCGFHLKGEAQHSIAWSQVRQFATQSS